MGIGKWVALDATSWHLELASQQRNIKSVTDKALSIKATEMKREVKKNLNKVTTRRTGDTYKSIVADRVAPRTYIVGSKYSVARFLEFGTKNMTKRPYFLPAVLKVGPTVPPFILERVAQTWKGSDRVSIHNSAGDGASLLGTGGGE